MKLANRTLTCGGPLGCGAIFEFREADTVEFAREHVRKHREDPNHAQDVLREQNTKRLLEGLAPLALEELMGKPVSKSARRDALYEAVKEGLV